MKFKKWVGKLNLFKTNILLFAVTEFFGGGGDYVRECFTDDFQLVISKVCPHTTTPFPSKKLSDNKMQYVLSYLGYVPLSAKCLVLLLPG